MARLGITKQFIYIIAAGIFPLLLGIFTGGSFSIFIIYNIICAALFIADYYVSFGVVPEGALMQVSRSGTDKLSLYEQEIIGFEIYNKTDHRLYIELIDEIPDFHFRVDNKLMKGEVASHAKSFFKYEVIPTKRGTFVFGNLHLRCQGRMRLCIKQLKLKLEREYKVYPNMKNLRKYRLGITNNRLYKQGQRNLRILGRGTSFESLREYVAGDEYRRINWKATARGERPIVNQYEPEKNQHVHMLIDTGRPMSYTVRGYRKLDMVVNTALVLSDIVNQNGDQSGLMLFDTQVRSMIMPGKGSGHRNAIMEALYHIDYNNQTSNYDDAFYYFKKKERHRSIVFLFTDFDTMEEAENIIKMLPVISKNNIIVIILIKNESMEAISAQRPDTQAALFNKGVALELLDERRRIINLLNRKGILCIECPAEKLEYTAVNKYIQVKNRMYM